MDQQDILNCLGKIKVTIASAGKTLAIGRFGGMVVNSLDPRSKNKYNELKEFLPQLETMEQNIINDINAITPLSKQLQKDMDGLYNKRNGVQTAITRIDNEINDLHLKISTHDVDIKKYESNIGRVCGYWAEACRELESKENELKQAWIPIYGLFIIKKLKRIENEEIPNLKQRIYQLQQEQDHYCDVCKECRKKKEQCNDQILELQKQVIPLQTELSEIINSIDSIHKKIALHINTMTYLSILHQRMETLYYHGGTDAKVMAVLDKSPEVMEYDDDVYFELLDQWKENRDEKVFQDFIMKAEKDFFSMS